MEPHTTTSEHQYRNGTGASIGMTCSQCQRRLSAKPNSLNPLILRHVIKCPLCRALRREYQTLDAKLFEALKIPVDPVLITRWQANTGTKPT